ncbi:MurR/RpiR family transcriptional regulator [Devosia nitrariae]|uniref:RpiR family transcriptional regulator n=1 Tax=Devosia nitrariae TaxID=2071872 RepID=A0ABQ5VZN4_9HYPH|nr:MurR/RpiR family transcriptional regulator [Devosia nitrariae]GLQ52885.1 RpiR family transcriptional regulator [Devosia nitrariae]
MTSVVDRFREVAEQLTPAEHQLIKQILASPRDVALGTASDLAQSIGVHEATASRLAKKLGYPNYAGFRAAIQEDFIVRTDPAARVRNTLRQGTEAGPLSDLIQQEVEALARLDQYVDDQSLLTAAQTLVAARRVFIFARGNAQALAVLMERRLRRMGRAVTQLGGDGRDIAEQGLGLGSGDALLGFAFRRQPTHYAPLFEHARKAGATTLVISGTVGPSLRPAADHLLFAPRAGGQDAFQTLTVPMAICNALVLAMAKIDPRVSLENLEKLGQLIEAFE